MAERKSSRSASNSSDAATRGRKNAASAAARSAAPDLDNRLQRTREVPGEIRDIFDPDRDPDETHRDAERLAIRRRDRSMGHGRRVRDERLDAPETFSERAEADAGEKRLRGLV